MKKFTNLNEERLKENKVINEEFNLNYQKCLQKIETIKIGLDDMAIEQTKNSWNWGYVGDMAHVNEILDSILEFLELNK